MAENTGEKQDANWPIPRFHFKVKFDDETVAFQEVSGLDTEYDVVEYRHGNSRDFDVIKMPNLKKASDVTLKKGKFKDNTKLFDFFASVKMNIVKLKTITISLLDEQDVVLFTWTLKNAYIKKVSGASLNSKTGDAAIEELLVSHEGITMTKG